MRWPVVMRKNDFEKEIDDSSPHHKRNEKCARLRSDMRYVLE